MKPPKADPPADGSILSDRCYTFQTETRLRCDLQNLIRLVIKSMTLRQIDVASRIARYAPEVGISQEDISRIVRGDLDGYSALRLMVILAALGTDVSIYPQPARGRSRITVLIAPSALRIPA
jgi:predicted XRE-type DNA-binding protein